MVLEYDTNIFIEDMSSILEDYAHWFGQVALCVSYDEEKHFLDDVTLPTSFSAWLAQANESKADVLTILNDIHEDLLKAAESLLAVLKDGDKPIYQDFSNFKNIYMDFLSHIHRLEKESTLKGRNVEKRTGLRSPKAIENDLKIELERVSRQGNPFSLLMVRIDAFDSSKNPEEILKKAVKNIKACMRSFDDAYYLGEGHFLVSLKHADILGAQAAVGRLQFFIKEDVEEGSSASMTMSFSMAEPMPGSDVDDLIENMRLDLDKHMRDSDTVLELVEVSPLERFVKQENTE